MPSISQAQILAVAGWVAAQAVAFGWLDTTQSQLILSLGASVLAAAWHFADAWRHNGNAKVKAAAIESPADTTTELNKVNKA